MSKSILKQYPLLFRLVFYVIGFSLFVALFLSCIQLWLAYTGELSRIQEQLEELRVSHENSLVKNIWNMDSEGIDIQLHSILQIPDVVAVVLEDNEGKITRVGELPEDLSNTVMESFPLTKELVDRSLSLGQLTLYALPGELKKRLGRELPVSLLAEVVALLLTGGFVLLIFVFKFNRHINRIAEFAQTLEIDTLDKQLILDRNKNRNSPPDELDRIVDSFNGMQFRLREEVETQQQTANRLQREIAFSDAIINSLPGVFVVFNKELKIVLFNELCAKKLGLQDNEINGFHFIGRVIVGERSRLKKILEGVFTDKKAVTLEVGMLSVDGIPVPYLFNGSYFILEENEYIIALGTDLTEQKKMEAMLNQAQKMEAIGSLAGGIAHDFNNILSSIMGNLQLAQIGRTDPEKLDGYLQSGIDASIRAKHLVAQILTMGRQDKLEKQPVQVSTLIKETVNLLRATIPTTIDIQLDLQSNGYIWANGTQIQQVLMNLCTNAHHAMQDGGGVLAIRLQEKEIKLAQHLPMVDLAVGRYLCLEVTDSGCGMDEETRKMIFEPYFTTKDKSSGTGLGLAVVHGIIQSHEGNISVCSEPGQGTVFNLYFPLLADPLLPTEKTEPVQEFPRGRERLMLVDDETEILSVCSELLETYGYETTIFSNSLDALHHFKENPAAYDLVLTDMTMPKLSGDVLGQKIMEIKPDVPVVVCTGFSKGMGHGDSLNAGFAAYLTKPVEAGELLFTVRRVLDEQRKTSLLVLLADDDPYNQQVVTMLLQAQGHTVCVAENGKICLQQIASQQFDVVFMDMQMPELDGLQTTAIIRACETGNSEDDRYKQYTGVSGESLYNNHISVIAMTGNLDEESKRQCQEAGMDDFLAKPFTIQAVNTLLARIAKKNDTDRSQNECPKNTENVEQETDDLAEAAMNHLQQIYPLSEEQLQQLLDESVRSIGQSMKKMEESLHQHNLTDLASAAHKTKGTLLGLGLGDQVSVCRQLEKCAGKSDIEKSKELYGRITQMLHSLLKKIE